MVGELVIPAKAGIQSGASFPPTTVFASCASPTLDSGLRRNDGGGRNGGGLVIPAKAGIQSDASFPPTTVFASCAPPPLDSGYQRNDGGD